MKRLFIYLAMLGAMLVSPAAAQAEIIGYFQGNAGGAITAAGHTPVQITNLATFDLNTIGVLWIFNPSNGDYANIQSEMGRVGDWVAGGGVLSFHDRRVVEAASILPGAGSTTFVRSLGTNIDILNNSTLVTNGPGGVITNTNLDGGNFSNHGFAVLGTLPGGGIAVLSNGNAGEVVDFYYPFGAGWVYYSTIPLDFYLAGAGNNPPADAFRDIYAVNEAAFQASLAQAIPEPTTLALCGLMGAGLVGYRLRRRKAVQA